MVVWTHGWGLELVILWRWCWPRSHQWMSEVVWCFGCSSCQTEAKWMFGVSNGISTRSKHVREFPRLKSSAGFGPTLGTDTGQSLDGSSQNVSILIWKTLNDLGEPSSQPLSWLKDPNKEKSQASICQYCTETDARIKFGQVYKCLTWQEGKRRYGNM